MDRHIALGIAFVLAACSTAERKVDSDANHARTDAAGPGGGDIDAPSGGGTDAGTDASLDAPATPANCGNGMMNNGEACDDSNVASNDGCSSTCTLEMTQTVTVANANLSVVDDAYNGTLGSMTCVTLNVAAWYTPAIASMTVLLGMDHTWIGDLVVKTVAPDDTVVTLMSRPGFAEPADDGTSGSGNKAKLVKANPVTFITGAANSAEMMGAGLDSNAVCLTDNICMFAPANGAAAAGNLTTFNGKPSTGMWKVCVGDSLGGDTGKIDRVTLTFNH